MASHGIKDKVAIVGMGCTPFREHWDKGTDDLLIDAFTETIADAGVERDAIDAFWLGTAQSGMSGITAAAPLQLDNKPALEAEFHRLALKVDTYFKGVIHRDFQCQNIMITTGGIPHVIDYQGARMAPAAYDVASILWDPYQRLDEGVRERLIEYYVSEVNKHSERFNEKSFRESLIPCRLQRHMQALGAYGFLSVVKGKKYFLKHIPEALRLLREETAAAQNDYPVLHQLVSGLR